MALQVSTSAMTDIVDVSAASYGGDPVMAAALPASEWMGGVGHLGRSWYSGWF